MSELVNKALRGVHRLRHLILETEGSDGIPSDVLFYLLQEIKDHLASDLNRSWDSRKKADRVKWWLEYMQAVLLCANGEALLEDVFAPSFLSTASTEDLLVVNDDSSEGTPRSAFYTTKKNCLMRGLHRVRSQILQLRWFAWRRKCCSRTMVFERLFKVGNEVFINLTHDDNSGAWVHPATHRLHARATPSKRTNTQQYSRAHHTSVAQSSSPILDHSVRTVIHTLSASLRAVCKAKEVRSWHPFRSLPLSTSRKLWQQVQPSSLKMQYVVLQFS